MVLPLSPRSQEFINKFLPFQSHFITIDGFQMHYLDEGPLDGGKGTVVLLHGNPTWVFYYRNLISSLRSEMRVIAPDFLGCGLSDHPSNKHYRARDRIEQISQLLAALGVEKFSLVMHDWGGSIGTGVAIKDPSRIEKLVYLNTTLTETESLPKIIKTAATPYIGKFLTQITRYFLKLTTTTGVGVYKKVPKEIRKGYLYPYKGRARRSAIWDFVRDIPFDGDHPTYAQMLELADKLPSLAKIPVQIIWGLRDICFHREMLDKVAEHFPQASVLEIVDASHLVLEDSPEIVIPAVTEFLVRGGGAGVRREMPRASEIKNPLLAGLFEQVERMPTKDAVIEPSFLDSVRYTHTHFRELLALVHKYQRGLTQLGLAAGDKVLMLVPPGKEFLALSFAVMSCGAIPVFLDPGMGQENLFKTIKELNPQALIGSFKAQLLRLKGKKLNLNLKFHITASEWLYTGGPNLSFLKKFSSRPLPPQNPGEAVFVAYTSGATGAPKGVVYTAEMLRAQLEIFRDTFGLESGKKDLPLLGVFSLFTLALGVCSVYPPLNPAKPLELEADKVVRVINDLEIDYSFGSPTLWNKIAEYCIRSCTEMPSMRKVFMAGAPVALQTLARVRSLVKNGEVFTPYGATESLPTTLISAAEIEAQKAEPSRSGEQGTLVGKAIAQVSLKIIECVEGVIENGSKARELAPYEIGEVIACGKNVSPSYFENAEATLKAKFKSSEGLWHRMGDMGYLDSSGNLYFCGRKAHMLKIEDLVLYSVPTERIFNQHPRVKRSALISLGGREAAIAIEPFPQDWPENEAEKEKFRQELLELAKANQLNTIQKFFFHPSFPVDARHNAKIFRDKLGRWAEQQSYYDSAA